MITLRPERAQLFDRVLVAASRGEPTLLCIEGDAGSGKTSHLKALLATATGFRVLGAYGVEDPYRPAYGILEQWGVPRVATDAGQAHNPAIAAQTLRRLMDDESRDEPLLLAIDDAQWVDMESLEALRLVLERLSGDRLLVVVAHRVFSRDQHRRWQGHCLEPGAATRLRLEGVDLAEATELARSAGGEEAASIAERLWRHTQGNPLHLRALLGEYPATRLASMAELPAPTDVALDLNARLAAMEPAAAELLRGVAVLAWLLIVENRIAEARRTLEALPAGELARADRRTRSRLLVLTAWTMLMSGYRVERIKGVLDQVPDGEPDDPALRGYFLRTAGQVAAREADFEHIRRDFDAAPTHAAETPMGHTERLAWRGAVYSLCGFAAEARRDLGEVVARVSGGRVDAGSGTSHALYGFALWLDGEIGLAAVEFRAATDLAPDRLHPLVQAALPLVPAAHGDLERADGLLADSAAVLRDLPWHEAIALHTQALIVRCHADPDDAVRATCLARLRSGFGSGVDSPDNPEGAIWHLHVALARTWAGELGEIEAHLRAIETDMIVPAWVAWARPWLLGLRDERAGATRRAFDALSRAAAVLNHELPLYAAHLHADLARVSGAVGEARTSTRASAAAREGYARLGATGYLARLDAGVEAASDPLAALSDRERGVASLLLGGLSYAQIAEELYVTRSTVAFHLSKIYAKTGVASRHELIRLVRGST